MENSTLTLPHDHVGRCGTRDECVGKRDAAARPITLLGLGWSSATAIASQSTFKPRASADDAARLPGNLQDRMCSPGPRQVPRGRLQICSDRSMVTPPSSGYISSRAGARLTTTLVSRRSVASEGLYMRYVRVAFVGSLLLSAACEPAREKAARLSAEGWIALGRGDVMGANACFEQALRADPKSLRARAGAGIVRARKRDFVGAASVLRSVEGAPPPPVIREVARDALAQLESGAIEPKDWAGFVGLYAIADEADDACAWLALIRRYEESPPGPAARPSIFEGLARRWSSREPTREPSFEEAASSLRLVRLQGAQAGRTATTCDELQTARAASLGHEQAMADRPGGGHTSLSGREGMRRRREAFDRAFLSTRIEMLRDKLAGGSGNSP
jgi:hypothetical protein